MAIADPSQASEIGFQQNPLAGASSSTLGGADWAQGQVKLDLARQGLQQQQQQHDEMKRQFNVKLGTQVYEEYNDILGLPKGPLKDQKLKAFQQTYEEAGVPIHEDWIAAAKDADFQVKWSKVIDGITGTKVNDPDTFNTAMENVRGIMGNKIAGDLTDKIVQGINMTKAASMRAQPFEDRIDAQAHQAVLTKLAGNPQLNQRLQQLQNLQNSLGLITDVDKVTPQQFQEFQQSIRSNLGIKGTTGVGEREGTYLNSLGLKASVFDQFLRASADDIGKNSQQLQHVKQLAQVEMRNAKSQYEKRLRAVGSGNDAMYARRPDLKQGLDNAIQSYKEQLSSDNTGKSISNKTDNSSAEAAPDNTVQLKKAAAIKQIYDAEQNPIKKKMILQKAITTFGTDILQSTGFVPKAGAQ